MKTSPEIDADLRRGNEPRWCTFKGERYVFVGCPGNNPPHGAIATAEQYENYEDSYAYLMIDGQVKRYGQVIGRRADVIITDELYKP